MICVIAKLTPDATERLNILRKAVVSKKQPVKPFYGHITIATYLPDDEEFVQVCSEIIRETPSFRIRYTKLEVLSETSVIVAVPSKPDVLLALHNKIAEKHGNSLDRWTCGTDWYPHTTLLYDPDADLNVLCRNMQGYFIPFETCISRIEFSRVAETGYTILKSIDLKQ
jgi:2'-5' RNA ligase